MKIFKTIILFLTIASFAFPMFPAAALTLFPARLQTEIAPGQSKQYEITLYNETGQDEYLNAVISPFNSKGEEGKPVIGGTDDENYPGWASLPVNSFVLKPNEYRNVHLNIDVPVNATAGGKYFAVIWESSAGPKGQDSQVAIASRVGTLVLLKVPGQDLNEKLEIKNFSIGKKLSISVPVVYSVKISNSGNVHSMPLGEVVIKDIFGRVTDTVKFNPGLDSILPGTERKLETQWHPGPFQIGIYKARLDMVYGEKLNRVSSSEIVFAILPWWLIAIAAVVIIAIILLILRKKFHKEVK